MNENKIIFQVSEDEESSGPFRIALAFIIIICAALLQLFGSITPGLT